MSGGGKCREGVNVAGVNDAGGGDAGGSVVLPTEWHVRFTKLLLSYLFNLGFCDSHVWSDEKLSNKSKSAL